MDIKRWAIAIGFAVVASAIVFGAFWAARQTGADGPVARLMTPVAPSASTPAAAISAGGTADAAKADAAPRASVPTAGPTGASDPASAPLAGALLARAEPARPDPAPATDAPRFDIVRVEPTGETVLAGQGAPNASVDLLASGKVVARAPTDATGHFVMLPPALKPGDYALTLRQAGADPGAPAKDSTQSVTVSVPGTGKGPVVVALAEPGRATKLLSPPPAAISTPSAQASTQSMRTRLVEPGAVGAAAIPPPGPLSLAIRSVELENGNGFYASGVAAPGAKLRVYLNDSHIADIVAAPDASWSIKVKKGLTGGRYVVRADATRDGSKVEARVEVTFDVPIAMAEAPRAVVNKSAPASALKPPRPASGKLSQVVIAQAARTGGGIPADLAAVAAARSKPVTTIGQRADAVAQAPQPAPAPLVLAPPVLAPPVATPPVLAPVLAPPVTAPPASAAPPRSTLSTASASVAASPSPTVVATAPEAGPSAAVIEEIQTTTVRGGDNLWDISRVRLGEGRRYTRIYAANVSQIRDPELIYPGQVFVLPSGDD